MKFRIPAVPAWPIFALVLSTMGVTALQAADSNSPAVLPEGRALQDIRLAPPIKG